MKGSKQQIGRCVVVLLCCGAAALSWAGSEGTSSTFYGQSAGLNNTGGSSSGNNTFLGMGAGLSNTSAQNNSFIGFSAGNSTTAGDNTYVGSQAGYSGTTANSNTFVGSSSGINNTASSNTFVGFDTGRSNAGPYNVFVGMRAGRVNTIGSLNTFVGGDAGSHNTEAQENTFVGSNAGLNTTTGGTNTFLGAGAGRYNTTGTSNVFVGDSAGFATDSGTQNTYVGVNTGNTNTSGAGNVFLGYYSGFSETGSNRLYIDNCYNNAGICNTPLVYGEFDNHRLRLNGMTEVHYNGLPKSQLNFSQGSTDTGGFLTSVLDNNFFMSSGARYDGALVAPNNWVQRSSDGKSVIQGSGALGYRVFTSQGNAVGAGFAPVVRLLIDYNGLFALNANSTVAGHELHTSSGAYLTTSGTWTNASSREYKEAITPLSADTAEKTLAALEPVTFRYKNEADQQRVGFIAEDVPDLVAMKDRKGLSPMDIVAVLTRVVQTQQKQLNALQAELAAMRAGSGKAQ
jgi:carbonic anhydrase/acetyltransferase-like protein (isoleucine patch superfamily)